MSKVYLSDYSDDKEIYHIDKNTFNNNISNLICVRKEEHQRKYITHIIKSKHHLIFQFKRDFIIGIVIYNC